MAVYDPNDPTKNEQSGTMPNASPTYTPPTGGVTGNGGSATPMIDDPRRAGIANAYQQYLGRAPQDFEYQHWLGNNDFASGIANSPEAQARAQGQTYQRTYNPMAGWEVSKLNNGPNNTKYNFGRAAQDFGFDGSNLQQVVDYFNQRYGGNARVTKADTVDFGENYGPVDVWNGNGYAQWLVPGPSGGSQTPTAYPLASQNPTATTFHANATGNGMTAPSAQGSVFSDPATAQWEQFIRSMTDRLNTPVPDSTKELQQTQALDPLERQRTQMKQQEALRLSQRGLQPGSGVYDDAMRNIDRQFNELRTRTQAGFANSAAQNEENRMLQAINLFQQIPNYQDTRMQLAQGTLMPSNVGSLLQLQQQGNQMNTAQQQQFWQWLGTLLAGSMG